MYDTLCKENRFKSKKAKYKLKPCLILTAHAQTFISVHVDITLKIILSNY